MHKRFIHFVFFLIFPTVTIWYWYGCHSPDMIDLKILGGIGLLQLLCVCLSWKSLQGSWLNPYLLWTAALYFFSFGQSLLYPFDLVPEKRDLLNFVILDIRITPEDIFNCQIITLVFLSAVHFGAIAALQPQKQKKTGEAFPVWQVNGLKRIGWILFIISIIPFFLRCFSLYSIAKNSGYDAIYEQPVQIGIQNWIPIMAGYFMPALLCLLAAYRTKRWMILFLYGLAGINIIFNLFTGGRTGAVILVGILILFHHHLIKKIKWKEFLLLAVIGYFFLAFLAVIALVRADLGRSFSSYFSLETVGGNTFLAASGTLAEMGGSMYPLIAVMQLNPDIFPFQYGSTFFYSLTTIIPNLGFWPLHPAQVHASLGDWLQRELELGYGPGFSIIAESYLNFGVYGIFFMFLYGFCLAMVFRRIGEAHDISYNLLSFVLIMIFCLLCLATVRNSFIAVVRCLFYSVLPIYVGACLLGKCNLESDKSKGTKTIDN